MRRFGLICLFLVIITLALKADDISECVVNQYNLIMEDMQDGMDDKLNSLMEVKQINGIVAMVAVNDAQGIYLIYPMISKEKIRVRQTVTDENVVITVKRELVTD